MTYYYSEELEEQKAEHSERISSNLTQRIVDETRLLECESKSRGAYFEGLRSKLRTMVEHNERLKIDLGSSDEQILLLEAAVQRMRDACIVPPAADTIPEETVAEENVEQTAKEDTCD